MFIKFARLYTGKGQCRDTGWVGMGRESLPNPFFFRDSHEERERQLLSDKKHTTHRSYTQSPGYSNPLLCDLSESMLRMAKYASSRTLPVQIPGKFCGKPLRPASFDVQIQLSHPVL